jgi:hypothetical protein
MEANMNAWREETTAYWKATKANPEKMESGTEHLEVPKEEEKVKPSGTTQRVNWRLYVCCSNCAVWRLNVWIEDFMCAVVQWYLEWDSYSSCVKIRCQETDRENFVQE